MTLDPVTHRVDLKNVYRSLNQLLAANGFAQISEEPAGDQLDYRQWAVAARVQDLEVITSRWGIGSEETLGQPRHDSSETMD